MSKPLLIIKNISHEGPGLLEVLLQEQGISYDTIDLSQSEALPDSPNGYQAVAVLGGPDSANDETSTMQAERAFVKQVLDQGLPYLGICLGLQVMVKVAGGEVVKSPYKEVGFHDHEQQPFEVIMKTHVGDHDPLFQDMGENFRVFQLHGETVKLTPDMDQLAIGRLVKNQVVKVGDNAYGIQCHFELTPEMFAEWLTIDPDLKAMDTTELQNQFDHIREDYLNVGQQLFSNFLKIAGY
jgi:GMP synthase (glutamine-hydrolysing)